MSALGTKIGSGFPLTFALKTALGLASGHSTRSGSKVPRDHGVEAVRWLILL